MKITQTTIWLLSLGVGVAITYGSPVLITVTLVIWGMACIAHIRSK